jgi:hypothetical protein
MKKTEFIQSMQILKADENDTIVLKIDRKISNREKFEMFRMVQNSLPESIKGKINILILDEGTDIGVLRKETA